MPNEREETAGVRDGHEAQILKWIDQYGASTVSDTIAACSMEWSYTGRPTRSPVADIKFLEEVHQRLAALPRAPKSGQSSGGPSH
jgi:hypothetical protein